MKFDQSYRVIIWKEIFIDFKIIKYKKNSYEEKLSKMMTSGKSSS